MQTFIDDIASKFKEEDFSENHFILPSRRAAQAFSKALFHKKNSSFLVPKVQSIEEFIESISGITIITSLETLFEFYKVYKEETNPSKQEPIEQVYNWGQSIIQDFNEIDRYDIDADQFFGNLKAIKDLEHWSNSEVKTELVKNYIEFWNSLPRYYKALKEDLRSKHKAYQGMAYLEALHQIEDYLALNKKRYNFIGFNALNTCEEKMIELVVKKGRGQVFWDIDKSLLKENSAGMFMRSYAKNWSVYKEKELIPTCNSYNDFKEINLYGVSKKIGQAKLVGDVLSKLTTDELNHTALILGDETLLQPILASLPKNIENLNVTMGSPLANTSLAPLFNIIFQLRSLNEDYIYYEQLFEILDHPNIKNSFQEEVLWLKEHLKANNIVFQDKLELFKKIDHLSSEFLQLMNLTTNTSNCSVLEFLDNCLKLIELLKPNLSHNSLSLEYLFGFKKLFLKLENLMDKSELINDFKVFNHIYLDILSKETLDFEGSPFEGLQIMGMLESRVLDFKNVIITSVNEGILPSGKSQNSFIPFDLKKAYKLPTFKEKDAIYAYHFFRLIQRATTCHFIYNNATTGVERAEKSRFIKQLEIFKSPQHRINNYTVSAKRDHSETSLEVIHKTPKMIKKLKALLSYGISPSALASYIRNPIDFYNRYVLGLKDLEDLEEDISYKALGTVIHECLDLLYRSYQGKNILEDDVNLMLQKYPNIIDQLLEKIYQKDSLSRGRNLIDAHIAKHQVKRFLLKEKEHLKGNTLKILEVEGKHEKPLKIEGIDFEVKLRGTVDRVDLFNDQLRIIDYKTGKVEAIQLSIPKDWEEFSSDYKYSKAFQILFYALLKEESLSQDATAGIVSFKNLNAGYMKCKRAKSNNNLLEFVNEFKGELSNLILEILNPEVPFTEKSV
ncbi:PD-(D/E)XK nuclease family protein [Psychroflexus tropicus]|uniref:PD-(D/E)XK nuclease family protein n=1 Tax=Psychroflexus tropicus TaxID=197345 RepID=UPI000361B41A|nr:PD-(D/E)XK nuclease family protein [Psychroflexus tropicus]